MNKSVISIPYSENISEKIKRLFKDINIRIVFRNKSKFNKFIKTGKNSLDLLDRMNVIYWFSCIYGQCYIGNFKLNEKYHDVISKHLKENDIVNHYFQRERVKIIQQENNFYKRTFAEMVFIKSKDKLK